MRVRSRTLVLTGFVAVVAASAVVGWWFLWPRYLLWSARRAAAGGNLVRAEEALRQFLTLEAEHPEARFLYAQVLRRQGRLRDAQQAFGRAVDQGLPQSAEREREYGLLLTRDEFARAEPLLVRQLDADAADGEVVQALVGGYLKAHRWHELEAVLSRWLQVEPGQPDALLQRAQARMEQEHFADAVQDFRALLRESPDHFHARLLLAHCLLSEARMGEAESELLACRQLRPDQAEPLVGLAACAVERNDLNKAQTLLNQARALEPDSTFVLNEVGDLHLFRQRYDLAVPVFELILRLDPRNRAAHLKLAQALIQTGDPKGAAEHEQRYQDLVAENARREENRLRRGPGESAPRAAAGASRAGATP
jgi:tetratricopeptide (TPR) repeat protein